METTQSSSCSADYTGPVRVVFKCSDDRFDGFLFLACSVFRSCFIYIYNNYPIYVGAVRVQEKGKTIFKS